MHIKCNTDTKFWEKKSQKWGHKDHKCQKASTAAVKWCLLYMTDKFYPINNEEYSFLDKIHIMTLVYMPMLTEEVRHGSTPR